MVHARNVKPPVAGAKLVSIDESSVRRPARIHQGRQQGQLRRGRLRARRAGDPRGPAAQGELAEAGDGAVPGVGGSVHLHARRDADVEQRRRASSAIPTRRSPARRRSSRPNTTFRSRGTPRSARRTRMADPSNGQMTIYSNDMKSYGMRNGVAQFLEMPREQVRVVWMEGPQGYGRTAADDAGFEAAFLAKEIGRPVRVQWMRNEETAWDTKGPAFAFKMRGGARRAGQPRRARLQRARRRLQPPRLQRARHRADRAADGHAARARRRAGSAATPSRDVRDPEPAHGRRTSSACRWSGRRRCAPATCAIRTARRSTFAVRIVHRRAGGGGEGRPGRSSA